MPAAIGIAVHSAWVATITVSSGPDGPAFVGRGRIDLVGDGLPAQAYHQAAESGLGPDEAAHLIESWSVSARAAARRHLEEAARLSEADGGPLTTCAFGAVPRDLPPLRSILRSHPLLHAAEGQLALGAVADAAAGLGLRVVHADAAAVAGPDTAAAVAAAVAALGRSAGRPWAADQKKAAAAALVALEHG
jgi:hypothetical protein